MTDFEWIVPVLGVVGVPLVISWIKSSIERGDQAQQRTIDKMQTDIETLKNSVGGKAGSDELKSDSAMVLAAISAVGAKVEALNTTMLTELGKRPTREEISALYQRRHVD